MAAFRCLLFSLSLCFLVISTTGRNLESIPRKLSSQSSSTRACDPSKFKSLKLDINQFAYCNSSLPYSVRVKDLVDRLTLEEKIKQLGNRASGASRIGLPAYEWWSEALHGVSNVGPGTYFDKVVPGATSFPTVILTAASFNESLWKAIGEVVSTEARAMYNLGRSGLTFWSPNINVVRDPRWGRTLETPGEDPYVVGRYAANYVRGLQDVEGSVNTPDLDSRPLKVSSCCKHYAAYDVDNWKGVERYTFDAKTTEQDMEETFLRPFEMCVRDGDVSSVMCSYNQVNGLPTCADPEILKNKIRGDWDLHGYIVSDCDSIEVLVDDQKWLQYTNEDAVAQTLRSGLDLDCGKTYPNHMGKAVKQGKIRASHIDKSLSYLYNVLMRLGFFDGSPAFDSLGKKDICSKEHIELATDAARQGIVLLKNQDQTLPLNNANIKTVAVIGPHAKATTAMIGNYAGIPCQYTSPVDGFKSYANVKHEKGCADVKCSDDSFIFPAMQAAQDADATVIVAGIGLSIEAESKDRSNLTLPGYQAQLINQVAGVSKGPVILVLMNAGGVDITFAKHNSKINAILWAGYPGEEGGRAIADVVFGTFNPGGRLPLTWHEQDYVNKLPMTSMQLRPQRKKGYPGRTYRFFNGKTVYPFGYGLSYTQFKYSPVLSQKSIEIKMNDFDKCKDIKLKQGVQIPSCPAMPIEDLELECSKHHITFQIDVKNVGSRDGSEAVIVYSKPPEMIVDAPIKQVIAFQRVFVKAGHSQRVTFNLNACKSLDIVDYNAYHLLASGQHTIMVGDNKLSFPVVVSYV